MSSMDMGNMDMQALMAALGGGMGGGMGGMEGAPAEAAPPPPAQQGSGNWLMDAINAVHSGMVEEQDPKIVSLLGAIIDRLTTVQERLMMPANGSSG